MFLPIHRFWWTINIPFSPFYVIDVTKFLQIILQYRFNGTVNMFIVIQEHLFVMCTYYTIKYNLNILLDICNAIENLYILW